MNQPSPTIQHTNNEMEQAMFTTTLTRTVKQPAVVELPFGPGDVIHWPAAGDIYHCYHRVESVTMGHSYELGATPWCKLVDVNDASRGGGWTNPVVNIKEPRVVQSNRPNWRTEPYRFETGETLDVVESFDVEHKWAVDDVIKGSFYSWTITEITERDGEACYHLVDKSDDYDSGPWRVTYIDGDEKYALVGGPRYVEPYTPKFEAGDKVTYDKWGDGGVSYAIDSFDGSVYIMRYLDGDGNEYGNTTRSIEVARFEQHATLTGGPRFEAEQARKMTALQALRSARDLISTPETWIKEAYDNHEGSFCAVGAIQHATDQAPYGVTAAAIGALANIIRPGVKTEAAIIDWNDAKDRTHEQVLAAFDVAIAQLALEEALS